MRNLGKGGRYIGREILFPPLSVLQGEKARSPIARSCICGRTTRAGRQFLPNLMRNPQKLSRWANPHFKSAHPLNFTTVWHLQTSRALRGTHANRAHQAYILSGLREDLSFSLKSPLLSSTNIRGEFHNIVSRDFLRSSGSPPAPLTPLERTLTEQLNSLRKEGNSI